MSLQTSNSTNYWRQLLLHLATNSLAVQTVCLLSNFCMMDAVASHTFLNFWVTFCLFRFALDDYVTIFIKNLFQLFLITVFAYFAEDSFQEEKILQFVEYNKFALVTTLTELNSARVYSSPMKLQVPYSSYFILFGYAS